MRHCTATSTAVIPDVVGAPNRLKYGIKRRLVMEQGGQTIVGSISAGVHELTGLLLAAKYVSGTHPCPGGAHGPE